MKVKEKEHGLLIPTKVPFGLVEALARCFTPRMRMEGEYIFIGQREGEINKLNFQLICLKFIEYSVTDEQQEVEYMAMSCRSRA